MHRKKARRRTKKASSKCCAPLCADFPIMHTTAVLIITAHVSYTTAAATVIIRYVAQLLQASWKWLDESYTELVVYLQVKCRQVFCCYSPPGE